MTYSYGVTEQLSREEASGLLGRLPYGRLGLAFENEAYVVPVSFAYDGEAIWFQIAREGKTTTYLQANPQACFEVDEVTEAGWGSVICYGNVTLSDTLESKREFLKLCGAEPAPDSEIEQTQMYICMLSLEEVTGRRSPGYAV